jgi:cytochrome bd ubiquinol oxidase subunit I
VTDLAFARGQMALSLAFHIVFAAVGVAMPLLMLIAEWRWRRSGDAEWLAITRAWSKGTAVFFAVGAVSGTVLSFELGLLFPRFMEHAGAVIGMPFSLEGFAFFTEAIFLGIYLYGWDKVSPKLHLAAGAVVAFSGVLSAVFVTIANAWMNAPRGFSVKDGKFFDIDPVAAMQSPFVLHEVVHTVLAAYMATAMAVAAIHAFALLRHPERTFHRKALGAALAMAIPSALLQPLVGHYAGQQVAQFQPLKLAAMEGLMQTQAGAALSIGPLHIPQALSLMAFNDPNAVVTGLDQFPVADWPPAITRVAFQIMVVLGSLAAVHASYTLFVWLRRRALPTGRRWLWLTVLLGPAGVMAMEAGWTVTEVGRQPWVIYGFLRTADAVTPMPGLWLPFVTFSLVYLGLGAVVLTVLLRHVRHTLEAVRP